MEIVHMHYNERLENTEISFDLHGKMDLTEDNLRK